MRKKINLLILIISMLILNIVHYTQQKKIIQSQKMCY